MKTWDVLDRETGAWRWTWVRSTRPRLALDEVAYCRETGEVVYR